LKSITITSIVKEQVIKSYSASYTKLIKHVKFHVATVVEPQNFTLDSYCYQ